ncbi:MAG: peptide deformylase [Armatimonadetes bacterium]|nr:peptide deformylase [Armatimonadota bacterium]
MAVRKILICGDPVLRRKAERVREVDDWIRQLLDDMVETMREAPGIGLAAPQVGESVRCIVALEHTEDKGEKVYKLVNPRVRGRGGEQTGYEGCLSLPTLHGEVTRPEWVVVSAQDESGQHVKVEATGLLARCLLHEIDHLDGVLFVDRAEPGSLKWAVPDEREEDGFRWEPAPLEEVMAAFERLRRRQAEQEAKSAEPDPAGEGP